MGTAASQVPMSYLDRYDSAPDAEKLKLVRQFMADDPLSFFKELRALRPVLVMPECTLVALYDDVIELLNMPNVFTAALYVPKMANGYMMMHDDDALHYREKSIMQGLLNRDDLPKVRQMVASACNSILTAAKGKIDAVSDYCRMVPATIVRDYFGLIGMGPQGSDRVVLLGAGRYFLQPAVRHRDSGANGSGSRPVTPTRVRSWGNISRR